MRIEITGRGFDITPAIKEYADKKAREAMEDFPSVMSAHIVLSVEKTRHNAEIRVRAKKKTFKIKEEAEDMYIALDRAHNKLERNMRKYIDKKIERRRKGHRDRFSISVISPGPTEAELPQAPVSPQILRSQEYSISALSLDEAVRALNEKKDNFIVFKNSETQRYNILFKREDGNLGLFTLE